MEGVDPFVGPKREGNAKIVVPDLPIRAPSAISRAVITAPPPPDSRNDNAFNFEAHAPSGKLSFLEELSAILHGRSVDGTLAWPIVVEVDLLHARKNQ